MTEKVSFFFMCLLVLNISSSTAQIRNDLDFVLAKITEDYAGLPFKKKVNVDSVIKNAQHHHNNDTFRIISEILLKYADKHLVIYDFDNKNLYADSILAIKKGKDVEASLKKRNLKKKTDKIEGYWKSDYNNCIVAIKRTPGSLTSYIGYTIASSSGIPYGAKLFKLEKTNKGYLTDYTEPDGKYRLFCYSYFRNQDTVLVNSSYGKWIKINRFSSLDLVKIKQYSFQPEISSLDSQTVLFKLPDYGVPNVNIVDSLVKEYHKKIIASKNLIIDIRNNAGGTIRAYYPLLPYIVSGNIIKQAYYQYCTPDIIEDKLNSLNNARKGGRLKRVLELELQIDTMKKSLGKYIFYKSDTLKFDTIFTFPSNVAIITNYACMSATEYMLFDCMQSKKVKVFGEPTGAANDYLDSYSITTPFYKYQLYIPATKRKISSFEKTDSQLRILPNVYLDESVPDWIEFTKKYYEKL